MSHFEFRFQVSNMSKLHVVPTLNHYKIRIIGLICLEMLVVAVWLSVHKGEAPLSRQTPLVGTHLSSRHTPPSRQTHPSRHTPFSRDTPFSRHTPFVGIPLVGTPLGTDI